MHLYTSPQAPEVKSFSDTTDERFDDDAVGNLRAMMASDLWMTMKNGVEEKSKSFTNREMLLPIISRTLPKRVGKNQRGLNVIGRCWFILISTLSNIIITVSTLRYRELLDDIERVSK